MGYIDLNNEPVNNVPEFVRSNVSCTKRLPFELNGQPNYDGRATLVMPPALSSFKVSSQPKFQTPKVKLTRVTSEEIERIRIKCYKYILP